jgi:hypothetical protein
LGGGADFAAAEAADEGADFEAAGAGAVAATAAVPGSQILIYPLLWILMPSQETVTVQSSAPTAATG